MFNLNTIITYPLLTLLSTVGKKSFENMGRLIRRSGDTVFRLLNPSKTSLEFSQSIAQSIFAGKKRLFLGIDDTLIKKVHAKMMQGSGLFFDTKIGRRIMAFRLVIGVITDGRYSIPIDCSYLFAKELLDAMINHRFPTKDEIAKTIVRTTLKLFPKTQITVVVDGLYSTRNFLLWCKINNIRLEARMHSNRVVEYKEKRVKIKDLLNIKGLRPKGRKMARTISVVWHSMELELTIVRRFDKKNRETIVFQIATYKALPREHVAHYKKRWPVEMLNRTTKQSLGLQECFSRKLETQHNHVSAVLLAYSLAQLEMKNTRLKTPEQAIRRLKTKNVNFLNARFARFLKDNPYVHA